MAFKKFPVSIFHAISKFQNSKWWQISTRVEETKDDRIWNFAIAAENHESQPNMSRILYSHKSSIAIGIRWLEVLFEAVRLVAIESIKVFR